jgi:hypothetical protein
MTLCAAGLTQLFNVLYDFVNSKRGMQFPFSASSGLMGVAPSGYLKFIIICSINLKEAFV